MTLATGPAWRSGSEPKTSPLNGQAPRLEQSLSDDAPPLFQKTAYGLTGNPQALRRLFMTEAFQVDQAHSFEFVDLQDQILQIPGRDSDRFEEAGPGKAGNLTGTVRTSQDGDLLPHEGIELPGRLVERQRARPDGPSLGQSRLAWTSRRRKGVLRRFICLHLEQGLAHLVQTTLQIIHPSVQGLNLCIRSRAPSHGLPPIGGRRRGWKAGIPVPLTTTMTMTPASSPPANTTPKAFRTATSRACSVTCWHADLLVLSSPRRDAIIRSNGSSYWHTPIIPFQETSVNRDFAKEQQV